MGAHACAWAGEPFVKAVFVLTPSPAVGSDSRRWRWQYTTTHHGSQLLYFSALIGGGTCHDDNLNLSSQTHPILSLKSSLEASKVRADQP